MTRVLFTGYAHVHFLCFRPIFDLLSREPGFEVLLSGGLRHDDDAGLRAHDAQAMYAPFDLPADSVVDASELEDLHVDVLFCANTKAITPRSFARSVQLFHGLSFRNRAIRAENAGFDNYFILGPYMHRAFARHGIVAFDDPRIVRAGFPKTDRLLDGSLSRDRTLAELGFSGDRPVILYAPTGARANSLETCGEEMLQLLTRADRYDVIVKPHDHPKAEIDWFERLASFEDEHLRVFRTPDVIPALHAADLLISDASSVANEYLLLDRPIVFVDVPELIAAAAAEDDRLDLMTWGRKGGAVAAGAAAVVDAVAVGLAEPQARSAVRRSIARDLFYNPGTATRAALDWLRGEEVLAA